MQRTLRTSGAITENKFRNTVWEDEKIQAEVD